MKMTKNLRLAVGAGIGLCTALVTYLLVWLSFGNLLAGGQSVLILALSILYPAAWGALELGYYTQRMVLYNKAVLRTILVAVGFVLGVFLWRYAAHLLDVILNGKLLTLAGMVLTLGFLGFTLYRLVMLLYRRPSED